jgi:hypothetical protein
MNIKESFLTTIGLFMNYKEQFIIFLTSIIVGLICYQNFNLSGFSFCAPVFIISLGLLYFKSESKGFTEYYDFLMTNKKNNIYNASVILLIGLIFGLTSEVTPASEQSLPQGWISTILVYTIVIVIMTLLIALIIAAFTTVFINEKPLSKAFSIIQNNVINIFIFSALFTLLVELGVNFYLLTSLTTYLVYFSILHDSDIFKANDKVKKESVIIMP